MKLNEANVIKVLIRSDVPMFPADIAKSLDCDVKPVIEYLDSLSNSGLLIRSKYNDDDPYSPRKGQSVFSASAIAREYLRQKRKNQMAYICAIVAAISGVLTLLVTLIAPTNM